LNRLGGDWSNRVKRGQLVTTVLIGGMCTALYVPVLVYLVQVWLASAYYSHGFLVLPVSALLVWSRRKELAEAKPAGVGAVVLTIGLVAYAVGFIYRIHWLWASSVIPVTAGLLLYFRGARATRSMLFPICFLIFMIPLPVLDSVTVPLQLASTSGSASMVRAFGLPVSNTGTEIQLAGSTFIIGATCSGMSTLISLLALTALFAYLLKGHYLKRTVLFLLAFPIAVAANVLRIALILFVAHFWGSEAALGFFHGLSSPIVFLIAILSLFLISRVSGCSLREADST